MKVDTSIIIPCYNEEENIHKVYCNIQEHIYEEINNYELIFVNDGSSDNSEEKIRQLARLDSHVKLVTLAKNSGCGCCMRAGFNIAQYHYVFYIDGDGQYDFSDAKRMLGLILNENLDLVFPYRGKREDKFHRKIISWIGNYLGKTAFQIRYKDINCGFKLFKKESLVDMKLKCNSAVLFGLEIHLKAKKLHLKVKQIPIRHLRRKTGVAKGINIKQFLLIFKDVLSLLGRK